MKYILVFIGLSFFAAQGQDLLGEKINKISGKKLSRYISKGIFHNGAITMSSTLINIRHSFVKGRGFERIVFDFSTDSVPRIYGFAAGNQKKMYIDFLNTKISPEVQSLGTTNSIESIKFFPIGSKSISIEIEFKTNIKMDVFHLVGPGRFVVDVKR